MQQFSRPDEQPSTSLNRCLESVGGGAATSRGSGVLSSSVSSSLRGTVSIHSSSFSLHLHPPEVIESFFLDESESEYYSLIRKFSNPNPNIIRDFKKDSNIFESLKRFEYSNIIRIIQLYLNKMWKIKSRKQELRKHIPKSS